MSEIVTFAPTNAGEGNEFVVPFPYLSQSHVKLYVNGVEDTGKTWPSDGTVRASVAITAGDIVVVKRQTPRDALITTLPTTGPLSSDSMNEQSLQAVYVATEAGDGLREGLSLDVATETYWEGAPLGINRTMKDGVDPTAAQEAVTKGWYDTILDTHATNAAGSASDAADSATNAAASESSASSSAAAATVSAAEAAASAAQSAIDLGLVSGTPQQWADAAEDWAIEVEDTLIIADSGGDLVDDYSSYHHAQKASAAQTAAEAAQTLAEAALARPPPWASSDLLGNEEGFAINWIGQNISVRDYGDAGKMLINKPFLQAQRDGDLTTFTPAGNDVAQFTFRGQYGNHSGDGTSTQWWGPTLSEKTFRPVGRIAGSTRSYGAIPHEIGNGVYFAGTLTGATRGASSGYGVTRTINDRNTSRLLEDSSTGVHRMDVQIGRTGTNAPADQKYKVVLIIQAGTHSDGYVAYYDDDSATLYGADIDLSDGSWANNGTHFAANFPSVEVIPLWDGWYRYDFHCPAPANDLDFNNAYFRVGIRNGASFSYAGGGTRDFYIDYCGFLTGWDRGMLLLNRNGGGSGRYRFGVSGPAGSIDTSFPTTGHLGYCSFWGHRYLADEFKNSTDDKLFTGWTDPAAGEMYMYRDATDGNLKVYIEDGSAAGETWDTGVNFPVVDTANNGRGTKLSWVLSLDEDAASNQLTLWYRINDGTITKVQRTLTTATGTFAAIDGSATYCGDTGSPSEVEGFMYVYDGYITRPMDDTLAAKYLRLHTHNSAD